MLQSIFVCLKFLYETLVIINKTLLAVVQFKRGDRIRRAARRGTREDRVSCTACGAKAELMSSPSRNEGQGLRHERIEAALPR